MVIDRLENIEKYTLLHPLFEQAIDFLNHMTCTLWKSARPN